MKPSPTDIDRLPCRWRNLVALKAPNFAYHGQVSVIRVELDASNDQVRARWSGTGSRCLGLRRALQRDAQARCHAYWAAPRERAMGAKALRNRLGLTRTGMLVLGVGSQARLRPRRDSSDASGPQSAPHPRP
jgi:hypothetical protein